jgi:hypothetical protein
MSGAAAKFGELAPALTAAADVGELAPLAAADRYRYRARTDRYLQSGQPLRSISVQLKPYAAVTTGTRCYSRCSGLTGPPIAIGVVARALLGRAVHGSI